MTIEKKIVYAIPKGANPLIGFLFKQMNEQGITMKQLSKKSGVHNATIGRWFRHEPTMLNYEACLNVLGYNLKIVKKETKK